MLSLSLLLLLLQSIGDGAESTSELYDKVRRKEFKKRKVGIARTVDIFFAITRFWG